MWKYLSYGIFGNCLPGEKVFTLMFTKQSEKVLFQGVLLISIFTFYLIHYKEQMQIKMSRWNHRNGDWTDADYFL